MYLQVTDVVVVRLDVTTPYTYNTYTNFDIQMQLKRAKSFNIFNLVMWSSVATLLLQLLLGLKVLQPYCVTSFSSFYELRCNICNVIV